MNDSRLKFKTPNEVETVYYEAFRHCDEKVMAALWADGDVVCVHPGSGAIVGYETVMRSWQYIMTDAQPPQIKYSVIKQTVSDGLAVHLVLEEIPTDGDETAMVMVTNVYQKFDSGWLMIEHHASLVQSRPKNVTVQ